MSHVRIRTYRGPSGRVSVSLAMEFRVLGPLELLGPTGVITVPGGRQRLLLAMLLLHPNEAVSAEGLAEAAFGAEAGTNAVSTVRVHVSRLRRALGDEADRLVTSAAGYELRVGPGELDSERFGELVETGRNALASDPERASAVLRDALGLWRGRPLADLEFAASAAARDRTAGGAAARRARAPDRRRPRLRPRRRGAPGAARPRPAPPAARALPRPVDARAVPRRTSGGCTRGAPPPACDRRRGARHRAFERTRRAPVRDPAPRPEPRRLAPSPARRARSGSRRGIRRGASSR